MAIVVLVATIIIVPINKIELNRKNRRKINKRKKERHQGGPYDSNKAFFGYCDVFVSSSQLWVLMPYLGSTFQGILREKK